MEPGAAEVVGLDDLAERRLHDRRTTEEDPADALDHDHLVAERRHVRAAGGAATEHDRELRQPGGRESGLAVERAAEVVLVGEDLVLERQERAAGVDEIDDAELVLERDVLGPDVLLDRHRDERSALHRGVVGDEHPRHAVHQADTGDDAGAGHLVVVLAPSGEGRQLHEGGAFVDHHVDAVAHHHLVAREVPLDRPLAAAPTVDRELLTLAQRRDLVGVVLCVLGEAFRRRVDLGPDRPHAATPFQ